jgi:hypothetical protein
VFYQWQRQVFENLAGAFGTPAATNGASKREKELAARTKELEAKLAKKDNVIAEISAEYVQLKKELGGSSRQNCDPAGESPAVSVARIGHVAMPHPGAGNQPGDAWCIRPGRPAPSAAVGAAWRPSECRGLNISE